MATCRMIDYISDPNKMPEISPGISHPGFLSRISGFVLSLKQWHEAGMPWRSPDETKDLFEKHCLGIIGRDSDGTIIAQQCPEYDPERRAFVGWPRGTCLACGCNVSADAYEILNKVNKPNQGCPLRKWLKVVEFAENSS